jgi:hypothetical protein
VVGDALALAFLATCRLAKQFLQAMAGVESMTVAINPADNSLSVVIELPSGIQQTTRDYPLRVELVWLQGAAIVSKLSGVPHWAAFNMHPHPRPRLNAGARLRPIMLKIVC